MEGIGICKGRRFAGNFGIFEWQLVLCRVCFVREGEEGWGCVGATQYVLMVVV